MFLSIPDKTLLRWDKDLVDLHKRVITSYLISRGIGYGTRKKVFILYDYYINEKNIRAYFYVPTGLLIRALVLDELSQVSMIINKDDGTKRKRKRTSNKK